MIVGILGYLTYGDRTPDLIIDRVSINKSGDMMMTVCRLALTLCQIVGIVIRSNANQANLSNIISKINCMVSQKYKIYRNIKNETNQIINSEKTTEENCVRNQPEILETESSQILKKENEDVVSNTILPQQGNEDPEFYTRIFLRFLMGIIPAFLAIFMKHSMIKYISSATGL